MSERPLGPGVINACAVARAPALFPPGGATLQLGSSSTDGNLIRFLKDLRAR